jgi:hypothetical protein
MPTRTVVGGGGITGAGTLGRKRGRGFYDHAG